MHRAGHMATDISAGSVRPLPGDCAASLIERLLGRERFEIGFIRVSSEAAEGMADHEEEQGKQQGAQQRGPN